MSEMPVPPGITDLHQRVMQIFSDQLNLEVPDIHTDLVESGLLDSLTLVDLLLHLEQEFGLETSADDLEIDNFRSVARIGEFLSTRIG